MPSTVRLTVALFAFAFLSAAPAHAAGPYADTHRVSFSGDDSDPGDAGPMTRGTVKPTDDKKKKAPPARGDDSTGADDPATEDPDDPASEEDPDGLTDKPDATPKKPVHDHDFSTTDDEVSIEQPKPPPPPAAPAARIPGPIDLDVAGKTPLADNYPVQVVAVDRDDVVIELPVLLAKARAAVPKGFLVIAEVYVGDTKVNEAREVVLPASLAESGPSFAWLKMMAPVTDKQGEIKVTVKKANLDGTGATALFTRATPYTLR